MPTFGGHKEPVWSEPVVWPQRCQTQTFIGLGWTRSGQWVRRRSDERAV